MDRRWSQEKSFFLLLLCFIILLHVFFLISKIRIVYPKKIQDIKRPIVVNLKKDQDITRQIVHSEDSESNKIEDNAFLSDKNRSFNRQTKARVVDSFQKASFPSGGTGQKKKPLGLSDLGAGVNSDPLHTAAKEYSRSKSGDQQINNPKMSSTSDYIEKIPEGDLTNLNTVEYKYFGFYHRIRQKLEQFWGRSLKEKNQQLTEQGRRLPESDELISELRVILDQKGNIISIKLSNTCGIKELDDAAIESFHDAAPFLNPPQGLVVDGKITLDWGFVVRPL